jgi:hypothetical protein
MMVGLPYHSDWEIMVLDPNFTMENLMDAILCMDGMFPDFPPYENLTFTMKPSPTLGVDYNKGSIDVGSYGVYDGPVPVRDHTIVIVNSDNELCQPKPIPFAWGWNKRVIVPTSIPSDVGFGIYKNIPYAMGQKLFSDMAFSGTARQYLYDSGNPNPTFEQRAWALIYMMWRFNFRDSVFPSLPLPAHVELSSVVVTPSAGDVGDVVNIKSTFTNYGEIPRTVTSYYQVIAHNQSLVSHGGIEDDILPGEDYTIENNWTISENAKRYQDITGADHIRICANMNG